MNLSKTEKNINLFVYRISPKSLFEASKDIKGFNNIWLNQSKNNWSSVSIDKCKPYEICSRSSNTDWRRLSSWQEDGITSKYLKRKVLSIEPSNSYLSRILPNWLKSIKWTLSCVTGKRRHRIAFYVSIADWWFSDSFNKFNWRRIVCRVVIG